MEFMGGSAQLRVPLVETEGTRRFGNKNKNSVFYFVFRSTCSTFAAELQMWKDLGSLQPLKKMLNQQGEHRRDSLRDQRPLSARITSQ
jgi:hypothetical protein